MKKALRFIPLGLASGLLLLSLSLSSCGGAQRRGPDNPRDQDLLSLAPAGASWAFALDFDSLRQSPWWERMKTFGDENEEIQSLKEKAGVDPFAEVGRLVVAGYSDNPDERKVVAIVKGTGQLESLKSVVRQSKTTKGEWQETDRDGYAFWSREDERVLFVPSGTMVITVASLEPNVLPVVVDEEGETLAQDPLFMPVLTKPETTFVSIARNVRLARFKEQFPALAKVQVDLLHFEGALGEGLDLAFKAQMGSEQQAQGLEKVLNVTLEKVRRQPALRLLGLDRFLDGIAITRSGMEVSGRLALSKTQIEELFVLLERIQRLQDLMKQGATPAGD